MMSDVVRLRYPESGLDKLWHLQKLLQDIPVGREGPWGGLPNTSTPRQSLLQPLSFPESQETQHSLQTRSLQGRWQQEKAQEAGDLERSRTWHIDARKRPTPLGNQPGLCKLVWSPFRFYSTHTHPQPP